MRDEFLFNMCEMGTKQSHVEEIRDQQIISRLVLTKNVFSERFT